MQEINEKVKVAIIFGDKGAIPVWFEWKGKKNKIEKISYVWKEKNGQMLLIHYSVLSNNVLYHLVWDKEKMIWFINGVEG